MSGGNLGIEGVYHVYMKWSPQTLVVENTAFGRLQLTFRNRQTADEFFRFCLTATTADGKNLLFESLVREGPQFWYFNNTPAAGATWELPRYVLQWNPTTWGKKVMLTLMQDWNGRSMDMIPVSATSEWLNGSAFYIKSTLNQDEFWFSVVGGLVIKSTTQRTKYVIRATNFKSDDRQVLIRSDPITIEMASRAGSSAPVYVSASGEGGQLVASGSAGKWTFGDLFTGFAVDDGGVVVKSSALSVVFDLV